MRIQRLLAMVLLCASAVCAAQTTVPTFTTLKASDGSTNIVAHYGMVPQINAVVSYPGDCPAPSQMPAMQGKLTLKRDGVVVRDFGFYIAFYRSCQNGTFTAGSDVGVLVEPGDYTYTVEYSGAPGLAPSVSAPLHLSVVPNYQQPAPPGSAKAGASNIMENAGTWACFAPPRYGFSPTATDTGATPPPAGLRFLSGFFTYQFSGCQYECDFICLPGAPFGTHPRMKVLIDTPALLPPSASVWAYTSGSSEVTPSWQRLPAQVYGGRAAFSAEGVSSTIQGVAAIAVPDGTPAVQDMWWAGQAENGWGLTLSQNGEDLFAGFFIYDDAGKPQWVVMSNGAWDATHTSYGGALYRPSGSWLGNYQASRLAVGAAVGTARLSFADETSGTLDLSIDGRAVHKAIARLPYAAPIQGAQAGLWWGGTTQNGWGLAISQQDRTLFAVWFTYDAQGKGIWYVMSGGTWTAENVYSGALYRTQGSGWLAGYDGTRFAATPVGTLTLRFSGVDLADMTYVVDGVSGTNPLVRQPF